MDTETSATDGPRPYLHAYVSILKKIWMENWLTAMLTMSQRVSVKFSTGEKSFKSGRIENYLLHKDL